jgi:capsid assembly protease
MEYPHIASMIFDQPLLILPQKLDAILSVLSPRLNLDVPRVKGDAAEERIERKPFSVLENGTAVIPVQGTLVHRGDFLDALSGLQTYSAIESMIDQAMESDDVQKLVLSLDSPGGSVNGLFDLVDKIHGLRGEKPITAIVDESAYSAAYAIASAADQIIVPRTGGVGSVGVVAKHIDQSALNEKAGLKVTTVFAGSKKVDLDPDNPLSDEARDWLQGMVNETYDLFVDTVARNRGLPTRNVRSTQAGLFMGKSAINAGLADQLASARHALIQSIHQEVKPMSDDHAMAEASKPAGNAPTSTTFEIDPKKGAEVIDIERIRAEASNVAMIEAKRIEIDRCCAITHACASLKRPDLAEEFIRAGMSEQQAKAELCDRLSAGEAAIDNTHTASIGNTQADIAASWDRAFKKIGGYR